MVLGKNVFSLNLFKFYFNDLEERTLELKLGWKLQVRRDSDVIKLVTELCLLNLEFVSNSTKNISGRNKLKKNAKKKKKLYCIEM